MQLKIKIATVDLTSSVRKETIRIESIITRRIDTCKLVIEDTTGSITIAPMDELIISNAAETVRYFGGYIRPVGFDLEGITKLYDCMAQDYTVLLDTVLVNEIYTDQTDAYIINDLFTTYLPEIDGSTYVSTGVTISRIVFNRCTLRQALDKIALISGFDWYVDYSKNLHYFGAAENSAPHGLSDDPDSSTTYPYSGLKYRKDPTQLINKVEIQGGYYKSDDTDFELPGDNQTTEFLLPYKLHAPDSETSILVYKNSNTDEAPNWGAALTVGIDHIDSLTEDGKDVLYNYNEKLLKFAVAPLDLTRAIKIHAKYEVPILVRVRSDASYVQYGRWFTKNIVDKSIDSKDWAKQVGKGILAKQAFEKEIGSLVCTQDGLISGQTVYIKNTKRGIDGYYTINRVITKLLGGTTALYTVHFGEYNPDLIDLIIATKAQAGQYQGVRDDETLLELLEQEETLTLAEATDRHEDLSPCTGRWIALPPTQGSGHHVVHEKLALAEATSREAHLSGQYCWAGDGDSDGLKEAQWDFFTWG